jgi:hypothetical protein
MQTKPNQAKLSLSAYKSNSDSKNFNSGQFSSASDTSKYKRGMIILRKSNGKHCFVNNEVYSENIFYT